MLGPFKVTNIFSFSIKNRGCRMSGGGFDVTLLIAPEKSETLSVDSFLFSSNVPEIYVENWGLKEPIASSQIPKTKKRKRLATEPFELCLKISKKIKSKKKTEFKVAFNCMAIIGIAKVPKCEFVELKI